MTSLALADLVTVGPASPVPAVVPWLGLVAGTLLALVGLVSLVQVLPRLRRARRTTGTVVEVHLVRPARGEVMWRLVLEYPGEEPGGPVRRGEWVGESTTDLTVYEPGMRLPLRSTPRPAPSSTCRAAGVRRPGSCRPACSSSDRSSRRGHGRLLSDPPGRTAPDGTDEQDRRQDRRQYRRQYRRARTEAQTDEQDRVPVRCQPRATTTAHARRTRHAGVITARSTRLRDTALSTTPSAR